MYEFFKFLHIAAAIVWLGAGVTFQVMNARVAAQKDPAALAVLSAQGEWFGRVFFSTASIVTLIAGVITVMLGPWSFASFWVSYGFLGIIASIVLGAVLVRRATEELNEVAVTDGGSSPRAEVLQRRLATLGVLDLVILFSVVAVMVYKPGA